MCYGSSLASTVKAESEEVERRGNNFIVHSRDKERDSLTGLAVSLTNQDAMHRSTDMILSGASQTSHLSSDAIRHRYQNGVGLRVLQSSSRRHRSCFLKSMGPRIIARLNSSADAARKLSWKMLCTNYPDGNTRVSEYRCRVSPRACPAIAGEKDQC